MVLEFNSRPLSVVHRSRQWHDHASGPPASLSTSPPPPPSAFVQSAMTQRRRSSAANFPPAAPPPSQPIPSVPLTLSGFSIGEEGASSGIPDDPDFISKHRSSISTSQSTGGRPAASANLAAVAAFSQNRYQQVSPSTPASTSTSPQPSSTMVTYAANSDSLSDPPPKSMLQSNHSKTQSNTQDIVPDRLLLSPHEPHTSSESRPSSRRALTRALELAREAVQLDATNDDPHAAVIAYGRSVALLSEVMERVRRGEDSTEGRRKNGRRRSVVAQEEEVRRLQAIVCHMRGARCQGKLTGRSLAARYVCRPNEYIELDIQHTTHTTFSFLGICPFHFDRVNTTAVTYLPVAFIGFSQVFFLCHRAHSGRSSAPGTQWRPQRRAGCARGYWFRDAERCSSLSGNFS
jgi:hypothetical protein